MCVFFLVDKRKSPPSTEISSHAQTHTKVRISVFGQRGARGMRHQDRFFKLGEVHVLIRMDHVGNWPTVNV